MKKTALPGGLFFAAALDFCQTKCYDTYARQNRR
nr:MAG TPA: hypothetical protein [Caudoviricetes sp.]